MGYMQTGPVCRGLEILQTEYLQGHRAGRIPEKDRETLGCSEDIC